MEGIRQMGQALSVCLGLCGLVAVVPRSGEAADIGADRGAATMLGMSQSTPSAHPRLWVNIQDLPRLRSLAADRTASPLGFVPAEAFAAIRRQADSYLNEKTVTYSTELPGLAGKPPKQWSYTLSDEAPPRHADYPHHPPWTGMSRFLELRITHLAFAALVTQESAYFEKAREMVLHLCKWPCVWTDPDYASPGACLDTSHLATAVTLFYDWCYDQLAADERALIRRALVEKAVEGLRRAIPGYGAVGWPNGFAVLTAGLGACAVALRGEDDRAEQWLAESLEFAKEFFDTQGKDGGCMEGPGYGTYAVDWLAKLLFVLESAGIQHSLLDHRFMTTLPRYAISLLCPNDQQHTGFGDCWIVQPFPLSMALLARRGDREAAWYLHEIGAVQCRNIEEFLTIAMKPEALTTPKRPEWNPSRAFVDIGYAALRDGFGTQGAFMAFKCGPPERVVDHNHYDHNSFQINFNGTWVATDPGYPHYYDAADYKYGRSTFGHNAIALDVDGAYLSNMGFPLAGHDQLHLNKGRIVAFHAGERFDYIKGAAAEAYNEEAGGANTCVHFWREGEDLGFARIDGPRPTATEWRQYEFSGVVPEGAASCALALQLGGRSGSVWYDDAELWVDGKKLDLPNPSFEEGTDEEFKRGKGGWQSRGWAAEAGKHEIDTQVAHTGRRSARIDAPGGYYYWIPAAGGRVPVKPGQKIIARFWAKCSPRTRWMTQADREVLFIKPYTFVIRDTLSAPQPHAYSYVLHTLGQVQPTDGNKAILQDGMARLEAHVFCPAGLTMKSGMFPGAEARGPYLSCTTEKVASTVITSVLIAREEPFKLTNPGFEAGMVGWTPRTAENCLKNHVIDEQVAYAGAKSGRIDSPGGYYYTPRFPVQAGDKVTVRFWAKLDGSPQRSAYVYSWRKGTLSGNATDAQAGPLVSGNEWRQYEFTAAIPPDSVQALVGFTFGGSGRVWYDDVEVILERDLERAPMAPGQVTALQDGRQGVAITVDGLCHLVAFRDGPQPSDVLLGGHRVAFDGAMACITLDPGGKPRASWLLEGSELRLDGQVLTPVLVSSGRVEQE